MRDLTKFAEEIRHQRIALKITQAELAGDCKKTSSYISKIENNQLQHPPAKKVIVSIAKALGLNEYKLTLMAGHIPEEMLELFYSVLLAYPKEKVIQILETAFSEAIF